jgi:hypothetical protein
VCNGDLSGGLREPAVLEQSTASGHEGCLQGMVSAGRGSPPKRRTLSLPSAVRVGTFPSVAPSQAATTVSERRHGEPRQPRAGWPGLLTEVGGRGCEVRTARTGILGSRGGSTAERIMIRHCRPRRRRGVATAQLACLSTLPPLEGTLGTRLVTEETRSHALVRRVRGEKRRLATAR